MGFSSELLQARLAGLAQCDGDVGGVRQCVRGGRAEAAAGLGHDVSRAADPRHRPVRRSDDGRARRDGRDAAGGDLRVVLRDGRRSLLSAAAGGGYASGGVGARCAPCQESGHGGVAARPREVHGAPHGGNELVCLKTREAPDVLRASLPTLVQEVGDQQAPWYPAGTAVFLVLTACTRFSRIRKFYSPWFSTPPPRFYSATMRGSIFFQLLKDSCYEWGWS